MDIAITAPNGISPVCGNLSGDFGVSFSNPEFISLVFCVKFELLFCVLFVFFLFILFWLLLLFVLLVLVLLLLLFGIFLSVSTGFGFVG